ncbi:hypothetical protein BXT86_05805 [candidate division WOR-3 bacterium 4484_100]|uniref:Periplasmic heavy metal sensor n=1 Tax=candidate division WOR-3 bacterium 4484_100 TaxID=1936077 RepID=A0A1V4QDY4_UNCW3|nr:MAG: hypothetical protein BXT86_05805 [candidate division WOR-3 bacterium 4484_100]
MKKAALIMFFGFFIVTAGYGQHFQGPRPDGPPGPRMGMLERMQMLNLSDEQRDKIADIQTNFRKKVIPIKAEIQLKEIDLKNEMRADEPNRTRIMNLVKAISELELKIKQADIDRRLKIRALLTPEQRKKLKNMPMPKRCVEHEVIKRID